VFSRRAAISGSRKYTREFFQTLVKDLSDSGFDDLTVLLPHNIVALDESSISPEELLRHERNYPSLILIAKAPTRSETLKILFVNNNARAVFADNTFPNAQSEPPQIYFQSPDPGRTYAVFEFFRDYLQKPSLVPYLTAWMAFNLSLLFILVQILSLFSLRKAALDAQFGWHPFFDVALSLVAMVLCFKFFAYPKGLWIKQERELRPLYLLNMAIRGEFRDNPLVTLVVSIVGAVIAGLILKWLGAFK
jgi:hypothetical protein